MSSPMVLLKSLTSLELGLKIRVRHRVFKLEVSVLLSASRLSVTKKLSREQA